MPFTFSHPAAVLPFKWLPKKWFSMTGLIIGSIVPDFESFLTGNPDKTYSHSLLGMFWFDLPLGLLLCFLFHDLVKRPLFMHLPLYFKRRFFRYSSFNWNAYFQRNFFIVLISLLIGTGSHLLWDKFTHATEYLPGAITRIRLIGNYKILLFILIQYISSVVGMLVVVFFIVAHPQQMDVPNVPITKYWLIVLVVTVVIAVFRLLNADLHQLSYRDVIANAVISALLMGIIVSSVFSKTSLNTI